MKPQIPLTLEILLRQSRSDDCRSYLNQVKTGEIEAFTTDLIVDSISITMDNYGCKPVDIRKFLLSLLKYKGLTLYALSITDRVAATQHMEERDLDFDDATTYAAMTALGTKEIVSMDRHFDRIKGIKRIEP